MAWVNDIPPLPKSINGIRGDSLRQQAESAWRAGHTIRNAIDQWEAWLEQARKGKIDCEAGDSIIRDGATAIDVICNLGIRDMPFAKSDDSSTDDEEGRPLWPWAPSDHLDPSFYDGSEPAYEQEIGTERGYLVHVLKPAIDKLLRLLAESPEAAIAERIRVTAKPPQAIIYGIPFSLKPTAVKLLSAIVKAGGEWVNGIQDREPAEPCCSGDAPGG